MLVTSVQPDDHKLEELVVREVYQTFKEWTMVNSQDSYAQPVAVAATHGVVDVYHAYGGAASGQTLPVQVLFKNLNVDLKEVSPSSLLMDKVRS